MKKNTTVLLVAIIFILLICMAFVAGYFLGLERQKQQIQFLQNEKAIAENRYAEGLETVRKERNLGLADNQASCYEYQKLKEAYEGLYARTGENSGLPLFTFPDSARGNEDSCYR